MAPDENVLMGASVAAAAEMTVPSFWVKYRAEVSPRRDRASSKLAIVSLACLRMLALRMD